MTSLEHRRRSRQLMEYAAGRLEAADAAAVERHLAACSACRSWLATCRLLEAAPSRDHPTAEELVRYTVDRGSLDNALCDRIRRHLSLCLACRHDVEQCQAAVLAATDERVGEPSQIRRRERPYRARLAVAAALAAAAIGVGWLVSAPRQEPRVARSVVVGQSFHDTTVIEATRSIKVVASSIGRGASLTLRAGEVALGDGFSVQQDSSLTVETTSQNR